MPSDFPSKKLLDWFALNQRPLPWREDYDPYHVWVSEIMAQQTRIGQMQPYFVRFIKKFPTVNALADADEQDVLKLWEGLGYYSRARNLHSAAKEVIKSHKGKLPRTQTELEKLSGFGPYISAAVASIAFRENVPVVDGNVLRVGARFWGMKDDVSFPATRKKMSALLQDVLPKGKAREFNQAMMELGATVCVPQNPLCVQCPLQKNCFAFENHAQNDFPVKSKKEKGKQKHIVMMVVRQGDRFWLVQRKTKLLNGLWEFPSVEFFPLHDSKKTIEEKFRAETGIPVKLGSNRGEFAHAFSHFMQHVHVFEAAAEKNLPLAKNKMEWSAFPQTKTQLRAWELLDNRSNSSKK